MTLPPPRDDEDPELGEPVSDLAELLDAEPTPTFLARIRRSIQRRVLASDVLELSWFAPVLIVLEFLDMMFQAWMRRGKANEGGSES